jgi:hypothetical protein
MTGKKQMLLGEKLGERRGPMRQKMCAVALLLLAMVLVIPPAAVAQMPVPRFGQRWDPWQWQKLGHSQTSTIHDYGCALTCAAMVINYYGIDTDPGRLNDWMKAKGGFSDDLIIWGAAEKLGNGIDFVGRWDWQTVPADLNVINAELDAGNPVIAEVRLPYNGAKQHFVVITGRSGATYYINDPWEGDQSTFQQRYHDPARYIYGIRVYHGTAPPTQPEVIFTDENGKGQVTNDPNREVVSWRVKGADIWGQGWDDEEVNPSFHTETGGLLLGYIPEYKRQGWHTAHVRAWKGGKAWDFYSKPYGFDSGATAGDYRSQWTYTYPSDYAGVVWVRVAPRPESRGGETRHDVRLEWGPWKTGFGIRFNGQDHASFIFGKNNNDAVPLTVTVDPPCNISFGVGQPPAGDVHDIGGIWHQ